MITRKLDMEDGYLKPGPQEDSLIAEEVLKNKLL
jgi:hypothetical protein